jgi:hypothetical protein
MGRHFIKDKNGKDVRKDDQTVYREHKGIFGGSSKVDTRYDPETGRFKK